MKKWVITFGGAWLLSIILAHVFTLHATTALSPEQIRTIAQQTTVVIAQDLKQGDNQALLEAFRPGSGVLVAKKADVYYVVTNFHVVSARGTDYGVRTPDGKVHFVEDEDTNDNIDTFGNFLNDRMQGSDLAILRFKAEPKQSYPIAKINLNLSAKEPVFVAGWPDPGPQFPSRTFRITPGVLSKLKTAEDGDYNAQYNAPTRRGMSGGPVFNWRGELIAIHGRGGGKNLPEYGEPDRDCLDTRNCFNRGISASVLVQRTQENQKYANLFVAPIYSPTEPRELAEQPSPFTAKAIKDIFNDFKRDLSETDRRIKQIEEKLQKLKLN